jgi:hypothetical protein
VVYLGSGKVEVQSIDYPELNTPQGKKVDHGVIIKPITTNICGSDQHMVRGRTTAPPGLVLGHLDFRRSHRMRERMLARGLGAKTTWLTPLGGF